MSTVWSGPSIAGFFARLAGAGLETRRPVFVFGLPRSGTTLIEQVLASHSSDPRRGRAAPGPPVVRRDPGRDRASAAPVDCLPLDADLRRAPAGRAHLDRLDRDRRRPSPRIVDKMPDNYLYLGLLAVLFPRATFIHCRRDLRDVAVSCWMTDFRSIRWANDPEHIAGRFQQYRRIMDHWRAVLPVPIHRGRLRGHGRATSRGSPGSWSPPAAWTGSRPVSSSTAPSGRSAPRASPRSASPSITQLRRPLEELRAGAGRTVCSAAPRWAWRLATPIAQERLTIGRGSPEEAGSYSTMLRPPGVCCRHVLPRLKVGHAIVNHSITD